MGDENRAPSAKNAQKTTTTKSKGGKTIEEMYTKKTQLEHILLRPDTYGMFVCHCIELCLIVFALFSHSGFH